MQKPFKSLCLIAASAFAFSALCGCNDSELGGGTAHAFADFPQYAYSDQPQTYNLGGFILNTDVQLTLSDYFGDREIYDKGAELWQYVVQTLIEIESCLSATVEGSCVYDFNQAAAGETVVIDKTCYEVLTLAKQLYEFTNGYYNPAVYYSVDLYGLAPGSQTGAYPYGEDGLPEERYVTAFKELAAGFTDIALGEKDGEYTATKPADAYAVIDGKTYSLKIDLGGIGKGYAADLINNKMSELGFGYGLFNFGSSSMALRAHRTSEGGNWHVGLVNPRKPVNSYCCINVRDESLSTSGDYEKYVEINGERYCHVIDPTTGSPIRTGIAGCTVIGGSAAECDALTTAISAMGRENAVEFINDRLVGVKVVFVCEDESGSLLVITNCPEDILELAEDFTVANTVDENGKIILK